MVTDKSVSGDVLLQARKLNILVVSSEWVVQGLITGAWPKYDGHQKYRHDFE